MTAGKDEGESSGSDSEPSADNLEESEMAKVLPVKEEPKLLEPPKEEVQDKSDMTCFTPAGDDISEPSPARSNDTYTVDVKHTSEMTTTTTTSSSSSSSTSVSVAANPKPTINTVR